MSPAGTRLQFYGAWRSWLWRRFGLDDAISARARADALSAGDGCAIVHRHEPADRGRVAARASLAAAWARRLRARATWLSPVSRATDRRNAASARSGSEWLAGRLTRGYLPLEDAVGLETSATELSLTRRSAVVLEPPVQLMCSTRRASARLQRSNRRTAARSRAPSDDAACGAPSRHAAGLRRQLLAATAVAIEGPDAAIEPGDRFVQIWQARRHQATSRRLPSQTKSCRINGSCYWHRGASRLGERNESPVLRPCVVKMSSRSSARCVASHIERTDTTRSDAASFLRVS